MQISLFLQEFFGLVGANKQANALGELEAYEEALIFDIEYMPDGVDKEGKKKRLEQVKNYIGLIKRIKDDEQIQKPLSEAFPRYPTPLERLMGSDESNLYTVILRPKEQDIQLRTTAIKPVFSLPHDSYDELGNRIIRSSLVYETLAHSYKDFVF